MSKEKIYRSGGFLATLSGWVGIVAQWLASDKLVVVSEMLGSAISPHAIYAALFTLFGGATIALAWPTIVWLCGIRGRKKEKLKQEEQEGCRIALEFMRGLVRIVEKHDWHRRKMTFTYENTEDRQELMEITKFLDRHCLVRSMDEKIPTIYEDTLKLISIVRYSGIEAAQDQVEKWQKNTDERDAK